MQISNTENDHLSYHDVMAKIESVLDALDDLNDIPESLKTEAKKHWDFPANQQQYKTNVDLVSRMVDSMVDSCEKSAFKAKQHKALLIALRQKIIVEKWV